MLSPTDPVLAPVDDMPKGAGRRGRWPVRWPPSARLAGPRAPCWPAASIGDYSGTVHLTVHPARLGDTAARRGRVVFHHASVWWDAIRHFLTATGALSAAADPGLHLSEEGPGFSHPPADMTGAAMESRQV